MPAKLPAKDWPGFVESTIRKAMNEGEFDNLPGAGKPISGLEEPYHEDWWIRSLLKREELAVPCPSLEIRRDVERTLLGLPNLRTELEVRRAIESLNARIAKVNRLGSAGPQTCVPVLDIAMILAQWRANRS
jgi:hypothetical protein